MKILILNPSYVKDFCRSARWAARSRGRVQRHPDYLALAAAVLERDNHEVKLVDAAAINMQQEDVRVEVERFKPDLAVIHTTTPSIYNDIHYAALCKEMTECETVMVGSHASSLPEEVLNYKRGAVDFVARREFDYTLRDLAAKEKPEGILGLSYLKKDGAVKHNPDRHYIENLDEMPFPAWHLIDPNWYFDGGKLYPFLTLIAGRGCPNRCTFCLLPQTMYGRYYRLRSASNVVDEIEYDFKEFPKIKEIMFEDDTLTADRKRLHGICDEILSRNLDITWSGNSRADLLDYELLRKMKRSGCRMLVIGYEFGSQQILNNVKKGLTLDTMKRFTSLAGRAGIKIHGCFMIGGPGETRETAEETIKFAKNIGCDTIQFSALTPYVGTEFYDWCERNNFVIAKDWVDWLDAGEQSTVIEYPQFRKEEMVSYVDRGLKEFYFNPRVVLNLILNTRSLSDFYRKSRGFINLISYLHKKN